MKINNKILVLGGTHYNTLSVIRSFGKEGISVDAIIVDTQPSKSFIPKSKYVNCCHFVNSEEQVLSVLDEKYGNEEYKPVLIICSDAISCLFDENYNKLIEKYYFPNAGECGRVTNYMNKAVQGELARTCDFSFPQSETIVAGEQESSLGIYPCIVKPLESFIGGKRIDKCYNAIELKRVLDKYPEGEKVQIQEFIERDYEITIVGTSVGGKCYIPGYSHKIRDFSGSSSFSQVKPAKYLPKGLVQSCEKMIEAIHYEGSFGFDILVRGNDFFFLEVNLRNDGTVYSVVEAGFNIPLVFALGITGQDYSDYMTNEIREILSINEFMDIPNILHFRISPLKYISDFKKSECRFYQNDDDPEPYMFERRIYALSLFSKFFNRIKRLFKIT